MATKKTTTGKAAAGARRTAAPKTSAKRTSKKRSTAKPTSAKTPKKLSALGAAAKVLSKSSEPMNTRQMIEAMAAGDFWTSPEGKTPHATLYAAILREITAKGAGARFRKVERGKFAVNG